MNSPKKINYNLENNNNNSLNLNTYSKEYLNELKNIYEKEKSELHYKNSTLQNNINRLKSSFAEQVKFKNLKN